MFEVGAFTFQQLAPLRLVKRALCDAASDPSLYRAYACFSVAAALKALPPFAANSVHRLTVRGNREIDLGAISRLMPNLTSLDVPHQDVINMDGSTLMLRELKLMKVDPGQGADLIRLFTTLECLYVSCMDRSPPIASLP